MNMNKIKKCLECQADLKGGRIDRKYCDAQCRASYHNSQRQEKEQSVRQINEILKKNWKILTMLNPTGHSTIRKSFLEEHGYNFNYFTNVYRNTKNGRIYYFCYDVGLAEVPKAHVPKVNLVNWQPYMSEYQLPIGIIEEDEKI
jgi:hypothetical protein